jgi:hypothetical protein
MHYRRRIFGGMTKHPPHNSPPLSKGVPRTIKDINAALANYLPYYNKKRLHFGLNLQTPLQDLTQGVSKVLIR